MKEFYTQAIAEAVALCTDIDLLDLVWKLLLIDGPQPGGNDTARKNERSKAA